MKTRQVELARRAGGEAQERGPLWEIAAQLYALEIVVARLYSSLAHETDDPEKFLDTAMMLCLRDAMRFAADRYPNEETIAAMRASIERMVKRFFSGFITESDAREKSE